MMIMIYKEFISDGRMITNCKPFKIIFSAQILLKPEGNYLYGFSYQSQTTTPRNAFDAKQYAGGTLKVSKGKVFNIQYNAVRYDTIQYNTIQYNTIQYNTIQYNTIQYKKIQYNTIQFDTT